MLYRTSARSVGALGPAPKYWQSVGLDVRICPTGVGLSTSIDARIHRVRSNSSASFLGVGPEKSVRSRRVLYFLGGSVKACANWSATVFSRDCSCGLVLVKIVHKEVRLRIVEEGRFGLSSRS